MNATESTTPCTDLATLIGEHRLPCQASFLGVSTWPSPWRIPTMWAPRRVAFETDNPHNAATVASMFEAGSAIVDNKWVETRRYIGAWGSTGLLVVDGEAYTIR